MFRFPKLNRVISALWSPRRRRLGERSSASKETQHHSVESEDHLLLDTSGASEGLYVKKEDEEEELEGKYHGLITATSETADPESKATNDGAASQLFTPATSSQKGDGNIQYIAPVHERSVAADNGNLSVSRKSSPDNGSYSLLTPTIKDKKGETESRGYIPVKTESICGDGHTALGGHHERSLPDDETSSSPTTRRKRKRDTGSDHTFSKRHTLRFDNSNGDNSSLQDAGTESYRDYRYETPRNRLTGRQPGLVPGTWLEIAGDWSEGELTEGNMRHNTPVSISDDEKSIVSSRTSRRPKKTRSNSNDEAYRPSPAVSNRGLRKSIVKLEVEDSDNPSEEGVWSEKDAVWKNEKSEVSFDFSIEKAKRWADAVKLPPGPWAEAEADLFFRLSMRGFEPIIPGNWHLDFPTLPGSLFAVDDGPEPLIQALNGSEFHAIKYLGDLLSLGCRVRDRMSMNLRPEPAIKRTIKKYIDWAARDANLHHCYSAIPIYNIYCMKKGETTRAAIQNLEKRLISTGEEYQEILQTESFAYSDSISYPVMTGFLVCGPIVAVITLNSASEAFSDSSSDTLCKLISQFDFGDDGQDVWNALAIALTVIRIRKTMLELAEKGRGGWLVSSVNCVPSIEDEDL
ncbi:hypothetical protein DTO207G8_3972 [Paecilomyces variotii]|nr:hypothetical protein DTO207G8_3972 [Paecilomyces variotii]KAJ9392668.1 hypothetical protein DTO063F5_468 [Paecilomyces variotii]